MVLARRPLRESVRDAVLQLVIGGDLAPGSRIREEELADRLGVSRTPVREALLGLERQGFVTTSMSQGFSVVPMTRREVEETYPLLWTLEGLALNMSREIDAIDVLKLRRLNRLFSLVTSPTRIKQLDEQWHATLLAGCKNQKLRIAIDDLKPIIGRYEYAHMLDEGHVSISVWQHRNMQDAVEARNLEHVGDLLEAHWRQEMEQVLEWLGQT